MLSNLVEAPSLIEQALGPPIVIQLMDKCMI